MAASAEADARQGRDQSPSCSTTPSQREGVDLPQVGEWLGRSLQRGFDKLDAELQRRRSSWTAELEIAALGKKGERLFATLEAERGAIQKQLEDLKLELLKALKKRDWLQEVSSLEGDCAVRDVAAADEQYADCDTGPRPPECPRAPKFQSPVELDKSLSQRPKPPTGAPEPLEAPQASLRSLALGQSSEALPGFVTEESDIVELSADAGKVQAPIDAPTRRFSVGSVTTEASTTSSTRGLFANEGKRDLPFAQAGSQTNRLSELMGAKKTEVKSIGSDDDGDDDGARVGLLPRLRLILEEVVAHTRFEAAFAILIMLNSMMMAFQAQYNGIQLGYDIGYPGSIQSAQSAWPLALEAFHVLEWVFASLFSLEVILKISAKRLGFFKDRWNILDLLTVVFWLIEALGSSFLPFPPMLLRLARLVRLLRLLRLVRKIQTFDSLYIMTASIKGSGWALLWSTAILSVVQMMIALWLNEMVQSSILDESLPLELRHQTYQYYGTFSRATVTLFELTLANWIDPARVLFENVSEWYLFFVLTHQLVIGFAMVKVIQGVFMHETFKVASTDDNIMVAERERAIKVHTSKMNRLLASADANFDGLIDREEFHTIVSDPSVKTWLSALGLDVSDNRDADTVFKLVDDEEKGQITPEQLVQRVARLKGDARSIDVTLLMKEVGGMKESLQQLAAAVERRGTEGAFDAGGPKSGRCEDTEPWRSSGVKRSEDRHTTASSVGSIRSTLQVKAASSRISLSGRGRLYKVVTGPVFEMVFTGLIILNAMVMALEGQYVGLETGFQIGYRTATRPAREILPWAPLTFEICEWIFGLLFSLELVMRIAAMRRQFFRESWHWFDTTIVVFWLVGRLGSADFPLDPLLLRVARMVRLLRLLRLVKTIRGFDSLYLMLTTLKGSCAALAWSTVLLFLVQMMIALVLVQMLEPYITDQGNDREPRHEIYMYFGTFSRAILTMFEITLANWAPVCWALAENVSEFYVIFSLFHKIIIGFAVVLVITGVFMQQTFKVAATDDTIMMMQQQRSMETHRKKMQLLFLAADEDGNGMLDRDEFQKIMGERAVRTWLAAMGLQVDDVDSIFQLVGGDSEDGLTADALVSGVAKLKGHARSLDVHLLMQEHKRLVHEVQQLAKLLPGSAAS